MCIMQELSLNNKHIIEAWNKGYRYNSIGEIISPSGKKLKQQFRCDYPEFSIKSVLLGKSVHIKVHRFIAYDKFGDIIFNDNIQVRHLDNDPSNSSPDNLDIGTPSQNMMDRNSRDRKQHAQLAASYVRKLTNEEAANIIRLHFSCGWTFKRIAEKYNLAKSTISYIVNGRTYV